MPDALQIWATALATRCSALVGAPTRLTLPQVAGASEPLAPRIEWEWVVAMTSDHDAPMRARAVDAPLQSWRILLTVEGPRLPRSPVDARVRFRIEGATTPSQNPARTLLFLMIRRPTTGRIAAHDWQDVLDAFRTHGVLGPKGTPRAPALGSGPACQWAPTAPHTALQEAGALLAHLITPPSH